MPSWNRTMNKFSKKSERELATCHVILQDIFNEVLIHYDCTIIQGHRTREQHEEYVKKGTTRVAYEQSKHRFNPSHAVDVAPYPIDWNDRDRFLHFSGFVLGIAEAYGYKLRWGGDWDGDRCFKNQTFEDLVHFEIDL